MKSLIRKSAMPLGALIAAIAFVMVSFIIISSAVTYADDGQQQHRGHLITIYDRGTQKVVLSDGPTIGDAVKAAGITLDSKDAVEPATSEKLIAADYKVNIYRARPVTVVDGNTRERVVTPYQTAAQIAKDAGITLYPEDNTSLDRVTNLTEGVGLQLTITRATPVTFVLYGASMTVRTHAVTVGDMLKEKGIKLASDDTLSVAASQPIVPGQTIELWRNGKQTVNVDENITFDTQQIQNADQPFGYKAVQTPGVLGKKTTTYVIEMKNGIEVNRVAIQSIVISQAIKQIEIIGTKLPTPTSPTENQQVGHQMMLNAGFGEDQWSCLYNLWMHESGWRTTAGNTSSGAYGIPQSLPASKMAAYGADYLTNGATQIAWGLDYIKGRYGTPCNAYAHWQNNNWY